MADALPLLVRMLETLKTTLGPDHEETVFIMHQPRRCLSARRSSSRRPSRCSNSRWPNRRPCPDPTPALTLKYMTCLAAAYQEAGRFDRAEPLLVDVLAQRRKADRPQSDVPSARNEFAWVLATKVPKVRDPAVAVGMARRAVEMARKAVELAPKRGDYWNTLGVALYRTGDRKAAIEALEKSESLSPGQHVAFNAFFLAMACWQVGQEDEARTWYDKAVAWMEKHGPKDKELLPLPRRGGGPARPDRLARRRARPAVRTRAEARSVASGIDPGAAGKLEPPSEATRGPLSARTISTPVVSKDYPIL